MGLNGVTLGVTNAPTAPSQVQARASILLANPGGAGPIMLQATTPAVAVNSGVVLGAPVVLGNLILGNLPNRVMRLTPLLIFWEVSTNAGRAWSPLAVTESPVYVTAQMPVATTRGPLSSGAGPVFTYLSLVDMSCGAAEGQAGGPGNAAAVKATIYGLFNPANPNPQVRRLNAPAGPPSGLVYWWNHAAGAQPAQSLNGRNPLPPWGEVTCSITRTATSPAGSGRIYLLPCGRCMGTAQRTKSRSWWPHRQIEGQTPWRTWSTAPYSWCATGFMAHTACSMRTTTRIRWYPWPHSTR